ncbi:Fic family protein [Verrucomicrobium sp. 3C]|uniref:Fic family protein n=1 Tax=Verrucomicrobium sp. 3C TaxID=1134055 RepID=UPI00035F403E|nr:Fic family protein [Verrucomicrobium sp. 3C]
MGKEKRNFDAAIEWRREMLGRLGGLPEPSVADKEWLDLLKEESRNSVMLEGYFVSEEEIERVLSSGRAETGNEKAFYGYFKAARFAYDLAYRCWKENAFLFDIPLIRSINSFVAGEGILRFGNVRIAGAKITPPDPSQIEPWLKFYIAYAESAKAHPSEEALARQHVLFECIHPFPDGNGRTGRILTNYLLVSCGFPPIVLKGDEESRKAYLKAIEEAERALASVLDESFDWENVASAMAGMEAGRLAALIGRQLKLSVERIIVSLGGERGVAGGPSRSGKGREAREESTLETGRTIADAIEDRRIGEENQGIVNSE